MCNLVLVFVRCCSARGSGRRDLSISTENLILFEKESFIRVLPGTGSMYLYVECRERDERPGRVVPGQVPVPGTGTGTWSSGRVAWRGLGVEWSVD